MKKFNFRLLASIIIILIYVGMAYMLILSDWFKDDFSPALRYIMGAVLFAYGAYRAYRLAASTKKQL